jgi:hypothetical protein
VCWLWLKILLDLGNRSLLWGWRVFSVSWERNGCAGNTVSIRMFERWTAAQASVFFGRCCGRRTRPRFPFFLSALARMLSRLCIAVIQLTANKISGRRRQRPRSTLSLPRDLFHLPMLQFMSKRCHKDKRSQLRSLQSGKYVGRVICKKCCVLQTLLTLRSTLLRDDT